VTTVGLETGVKS